MTHSKFYGSTTANRKDDHIRINLDQPVQSGLKTGFEGVKFVHQALPELDYNKLNTTTSFLGKSLQFPLLISSMTGGTEKGQLINEHLAKVAETKGIAIGLGSMRILLEEPKYLKTFDVRTIAPTALLLANLGAIQLNYGVDAKQCKWLVEQVQADGLILHLNVLQELVQPEGNKNWEGLLIKIEALIKDLPIPIIVKEVGYGLSKKVAKQLIEIGVYGLDVSGAGGTSWSQVEAHRAPTNLQKQVAESFVNWGIPTLESLRQIRQVSKTIPIIASGGIYSGIDGAKAIHAGANLFGIAAPLLKAAITSETAVIEMVDCIMEQLKIVMMCTQSAQLSDLTKAETW
jgi:isopentenyl-diphosphate delta-isomerase